jgi:ribosomal protein S18 acetylase RimI-like enzyme
LKAVLDKKIAGSVRAHLESGTCYIGKLIVHPNHQNVGIGTRLLQVVERQFPDSERYELFTGNKSGKNLHIYKKHGYRIFKDEVVSEKLTLVFLERINTGET